MDEGASWPAGDDGAVLGKATFFKIFQSPLLGIEAGYQESTTAVLQLSIFRIFLFHQQKRELFLNT